MQIRPEIYVKFAFSSGLDPHLFDAEFSIFWIWVLRPKFVRLAPQIYQIYCESWFFVFKFWRKIKKSNLICLG